MTVHRGVLLDLDGTLYEDQRALPGAVGAVRRLRDAGLRLRFLSNTSRRPRRAVFVDLQEMGFTDDVNEVQTAPAVAAAWLATRGIRRVALLVANETQEDFPGFEIDETAPEAVVVGDLGDDWNVHTLNRAFRWLLGGADLVALQRNRYWKRQGDLVLDAGPFVAALEYAANVEATVVGKPSAAFFRMAVESLGLQPKEVVMVGDDLANDVGGAQAIGCPGVLVQTGKYRAGEEVGGAVAPDAVVESIAELPRLDFDTIRPGR